MGTMEILTAVLVIVTAIYAYLTHKMASTSQATLQEMREQTWAATRPQVLVEPYVRPATPFLYLRVHNVGRTTANNLSLKLDKEFWQFGERKDDHALHMKRAFAEKIDALHPGQKLNFALAQGWKIFGNESNEAICPSYFTATASYTHAGRTISEKFPIDLSIYLGSEGEHLPIAEELEKLRKAIEKRPAA
ncbi:MAG: hypothetical protein K0M64_05330 [Rhizobium sp.]|nr:hypothetical protein [Rhizobium sp.]